MNLELVGALNELERERGIAKEILFEAIEAAIVSAFKRSHPTAQNVRVDVGERTGEIKVFAQKDVVEEVFDEDCEISIEDAQAINPAYEMEDVVELDVTPSNFGRIAAQTAKQVVVQRIREAERALIFEEFANREGDVVTGIVQRADRRAVWIDLGKIEALLPPAEQMDREMYTHGMRLKVYISEVRQTPKGPQVYVSRSHPGLLSRLFELEVPEIHDGVVEVKSVAREAGKRSKIAVFSRDLHVDAVGACVGPRGMRVQTVVSELKGEKIDIIPWHPDAARFISNALSPARVSRVLVDEAERTARAVVPDHQLSLAIGREGQNARLAARLSGFKIDIKSESQMEQLEALQLEREAAEAAERGLGEPVAPEAEDVPVVAAAPETVEEVGVEAEPELIEEPDLQSDPEVEPAPTEPAPEPARSAPADDKPEPIDAFDLEPGSNGDGKGKPRETPTPPSRKSRAAKKAEVLERIEEEVEVTSDDENVPSLFEGKEEPPEVTEETVFVVGGDDDEQQSSGDKGRGARDKKGKGKRDKKNDRTILHDLSDLARLLEEE